VLIPVRSISGAPKTVIGKAGAPAAKGISVPVTTNRSSVTRSSAAADGAEVAAGAVVGGVVVRPGGVGVVGLEGAAVVCANTAENAPALAKQASAATSFRVRMFIVIGFCGCSLSEMGFAINAVAAGMVRITVEKFYGSAGKFRFLQAFTCLSTERWRVGSSR
jgi:hypothetical protein